MLHSEQAAAPGLIIMGTIRLIKPENRDSAIQMFKALSGAKDYEIGEDERAFIKRLITIRGHGAAIMERRILAFDEAYENRRQMLRSRMLPHSPSFGKVAPQTSMPTMSKADQYVIELEEMKKQYSEDLHSLDYWFKLNDALHSVIDQVFREDPALHRLAELYYFDSPSRIDDLLLSINGCLTLHPDCKNADIYQELMERYPVSGGHVAASASAARAAVHDTFLGKEISFPVFTPEEIEAVVDTETIDDYRPHKHEASPYDIFEQSVIIGDGKRVSILQISRQLWLQLEKLDAHDAGVFTEHPEVKIQTDWRSGPHHRLEPVNPLLL